VVDVLKKTQRGRAELETPLTRMLNERWSQTYTAGHRYHHATDPSKTIVEIWPLAGECEVFGKEVVSSSGKILLNHTIPSVEKVSQPTFSPQTHRKE